MATIYVVTRGHSVTLVTPSLEKAQDYCRENGGYYDQACGHRFQPEFDGGKRAFHSYLSGRSNRWNKSDYVITEIEVTG
jgi:hypothetical protein